MSNRMKGLFLTLVGMCGLAAGCGDAGHGGNGRDPAYSDITVLANPESTAYGDASVQPLVRLDGVRGADWLSDDILLVSKENPDEKPAVFDGTEFRPLNLYVRSLSTGKEEALAPGPENQGYARSNPGRTLIFYKTFDWQSPVGTGYVMDLKTRRSLRVTETDELELSSGVWLDDRTILYAATDGRLVSVSADGTERKIWPPDSQAPRIGNVAAAGGKVYYSAPSGVLLSYDPKTGERTVVGKNAVWASPSADGKKLAIVQRIRSGSMELSVTDSDVRNRLAIAQDAQIFGLAWTSAGDRLAFAGIEPSGMTRGIYVADIATGKTATLPIDVNFIADPPRWNPSGDRLMVTAAIARAERGKASFVTYLAAAK